MRHMPPVSTHLYRFLALGDSYTIGEGVPPEASWPRQLAGRLALTGWQPAELTIVARTGWTTAELIDAASTWSISPPYDLVSVLAGVNDQYRGGSIDDYANRCEELLGLAVRWAGDHPGRVLVVSIPDWGVTPFAHRHTSRDIAAAIDAFNRVNREAARVWGCRYVDVTAISRRRAGWLAADALHPSPRQYAEWAEGALPEALQALGDPRGPDD